MTVVVLVGRGALARAGLGEERQLGEGNLSGCGLVRGGSVSWWSGRSGVYPAVVSLTVNLPGELGAALEAEAARLGQTPERVAADLLAAGLLTPRNPQAGVRRVLAFAALGESTTGVSAADAEELLAEGFGRE